MTNSDQGDKPVVRAGRRRPVDRQPPGGRERAQAPRREGRTDQSRTTAPVSSPSKRDPSRNNQAHIQAPGQGLGSLSLGRWIRHGLSRAHSDDTRYSGSDRHLTLFMQSGGGGGEWRWRACSLGRVRARPGRGGASYLHSRHRAAYRQAPCLPPPPRQRRTRRPLPPRSSTGNSWLVMLYQDADDKILEKDIYVDLNEAERVGSSDKVRIVAQMDRYAGGYAEDGDWTDTKRFYVTRTTTCSTCDLRSRRRHGRAKHGRRQHAGGLCHLGRARPIPADKLVLILSDHGMGWPGGWSDPAPAAAKDNSTPLSCCAGQPDAPQ